MTRFLASIMICASAAAFGADLNTLTPEETTAGWKLLFDGGTTIGWRACGREEFPAERWLVKDGCLCVEKPGSANAIDLVTTDKFGDFDLKFQWRISPAGNSGVKYFVKEPKTGRSGLGFEYQVLDDDKNEDALNGPKRRAGALYYLFAPNDQKRLNPVGEFNDGEIIVRGNHVEHWLNGAKIVEFELGSAELKQAIAQSKFSKIKGFGEKIPTVILLQDHGSPVWFRNIKIRPLN
ncbi:MAG TPA: DUF1080 domain-containing protein [Candidatus Baltobacteraceae bacterium]|nr:DUF1080 domain-containing protein [Candidatus Baltobacteraceae bacterium]